MKPATNSAEKNDKALVDVAEVKAETEEKKPEASVEAAKAEESKPEPEIVE